MNKLILAIFLFSISAMAETITPTTVEEFEQTSVRIFKGKYDVSKGSHEGGGTGSVFKSYPKATHILTNKHICRLIEQGGTVERNGKTYKITHYKKFPNHDLCLVRIRVGLGIETELGDSIAQKSSISYISGHPNLLPHIVTKGHLSSRKDINLVVGIKECTEEDSDFGCAWFGGRPDYKTFDAQVASNLIKPGSSGSAVFNDAGQVVGVAFAAAGGGREFSHAYIVPHIYLLFFLQNAHRYDWVKVGTEVDDGQYVERFFNYNKCIKAQAKTSKKYKGIQKLCDTISDNMLWRK